MKDGVYLGLKCAFVVEVNTMFGHVCAVTAKNSNGTTPTTRRKGSGLYDKMKSAI